MTLPKSFSIHDFHLSFESYIGIDDFVFLLRSEKEELFQTGFLSNESITHPSPVHRLLLCSPDDACDSPDAPSPSLLPLHCRVSRLILLIAGQLGRGE